MSNTVYILLKPAYRSNQKFYVPDKPNMACSPEQFQNRIACFHEFLSNPLFPALCSHICAESWGRPNSNGDCELIYTEYFYLQTGAKVKPEFCTVKETL